DAICCFGLTPAQYYVLETLADESMGVGDLARAHGVAISTMTRVLQGLQAKRLVATRQEPRDGRRRQAALTARGKQRWRTIRQAVLATEARIFNQFDSRGQQAIVTAIKRLLEGFNGRGCCPPQTAASPVTNRRRKR
ncbi:MAG: MarR family transcriptional regulator, partial [Nitrospirae bacterium]|nr:MarR family transcriptional regulator [Nitrospirota bacterium]